MLRAYCRGRQDSVDYALHQTLFGAGFKTPDSVIGSWTFPPDTTISEGIALHNSLLSPPPLSEFARSVGCQQNHGGLFWASGRSDSTPTFHISRSSVLHLLSLTSTNNGSPEYDIPKSFEHIRHDRFLHHRSFHLKNQDDIRPLTARRPRPTLVATRLHTAIDSTIVSCQYSYRLRWRWSVRDR